MVISNARLAVFAAAAVVGIVAIVQQSAAGLAVAGLLLVAFAGLIAYHRRLAAIRGGASALAAYNSDGLARRARDWPALPARTTPDVATHAYAADLDLFGPASLEAMVDSIGAGVGQPVLRGWLLAPADPATIAVRQAAVADLAPRVDLREALAIAARAAHAPVGAVESFLEWAGGEPWLRSRPLLAWGGRLNVVVLWMLLALQIAGVVPYPIWMLCAGVNLLITATAGRTIYAILDRVSLRSGAFRQYAVSFAAISAAQFEAPMLRQAQIDLTANGLPAPEALARLARIVQFVAPAAAATYLLVQTLTLWDLWVLAALEGWQQQAGRSARRWIETLATVEALSALGTLAFDQPAWTFPVVDPVAASVAFHDLGHPLLADDARVTNDVTVGPAGTFLLVTGSNMSGKSTLLRAIGTNVVLAGCGAPVCASAGSLPPLALWTSMRVQDSLAKGVSFFMAELQRLKAVVDAAREGPVLYLLDEILQGTNTAERRIAARAIIQQLIESGAIGAVSTHDLTLADSADLAAAAQPIHFRETVTNDGGPAMTFDYRARPGIATSTNALRLMEIVGIAVS